MCNWNTRRRRKTNRAEEIFEVIIAKNFSQLMTDTKPQIQGVHRTSSRISQKHLYLTYSNYRKPDNL
jgi:hypothetical protein